MHWQTTRFRISLARPLVMGIVNVTPDSFSDGGNFALTDTAIRHCDRLTSDGADVLDIGGESTRPGAVPCSLEVELGRVIPVLKHALTLGLPVSIDTSRPEVMRCALGLGVDIINDVRALQQPGALQALAASSSAGVCLMHMRGEPGTMQDEPDYADVVADVAAFLQGRIQAVLAAGVAFDRIVVDPGIGFGKAADHNWTLLRRQAELLRLGCPLLVGWSRKSPLGRLTGRPVADRQAASVAAALASVQRGAAVVRVHDVAATVDAIKVWQMAGLWPPVGR